MSQPFSGPAVPTKADPNLPTQPSFSTWCVGWGAYDVPRIFSILQPTKDEISWGQAAGFRQLATLLLDHQTALRIQRDQLATAWQGPASAVLLSRIDNLAEALLSDSHCATATANALDSIMAVYSNARKRIEVLQDCWNDTTAKWQPFCWDASAAELNTEAQKLMYAVDSAIRDHRSKITIPNAFEPPHLRMDLWTMEPHASEPHESGSRTVVPPIPGYEPLEAPSGSSSFGVTGDGLAGLPAYIPATPGQPVSMLPIPPGSAYAPYGGAYVLPGPGVGPRGYVVPMPHRSNEIQIGRPLPAAPISVGGSSGVMPMPVALQSRGAGEGTPRVLYRRRPETWKTNTGVAPVILAPDEDEFIPGQPSEKQEKAFLDWFTDLAYPWRAESSNGEAQPKVEFRKVEE